MATPHNPIMKTVSDLAMAGEQAGFTVEQMLELLDTGVTVETLMDMIAFRLYGVALAPPASSRWVA